MKFSMDMLLTCILYCDAGPGCLIRTVSKYSMVLLILNIIYSYICLHLVFLQKGRSFSSRKLHISLD